MKSVQSSVEAGESRWSEGTQEDGCGMTRKKQRNYESVTVPFAATPAEAPPSIVDWANRCVWTDRMLTTLQTGVQGGKWHTLIDKVFSPLNLFAASRKVTGRQTKAAGIDHQSVKDFDKNSSQELKRLHTVLRDDTYVPQAVRRVWIPKPGSTEQRPLGVPTVRDRVVQTALLNVLEPIFDQTFSEHSYGFRHGRGCHHALARVEELLNSGHVHVVDADLKSYFDTIPKDQLLARVGEKVSDSRILRLIQMFLEQGVLEGLSEWTPEAGTPQGAVISPLLANIYLNPLDHLLEEAGFAMVRYADDFVILCQTPEAAERALEMVRSWVVTNGLTLHPTKTQIVDARTQSFAFLGYAFRGELRFPREKSLHKLEDSIRQKTRRTQGDDLRTICRRLSWTLRGWFNYFRHCHWTIFRELDEWIRGRLRSILRKRRKRRGRARGKDHQRWPNSHFDKHGLYSLLTAHVRLVQSSPR
jgi:RNA-directed DNA polymerase